MTEKRAGTPSSHHVVSAGAPALPANSSLFISVHKDGPLCRHETSRTCVEPLIGPVQIQLEAPRRSWSASTGSFTGAAGHCTAKRGIALCLQRPRLGAPTTAHALARTSTEAAPPISGLLNLLPDGVPGCRPGSWADYAQRRGSYHSDNDVRRWT